MYMAPLIFLGPGRPPLQPCPRAGPGGRAVEMRISDNMEDRAVVLDLEG
jgi:hypothetical protein